MLEDCYILRVEEEGSRILTNKDIFQETWFRVGDVGKPTTHDFKY